MSDDRIARQIAFLIRADHLKTVIRRTPLIDNSRLENSAEHSWHLTLAALALAEHAPSSLDIGRVLQLLVVHDLVEIDAGDTYAYDPAAHVDKTERERAAAEKIFGVLPDNQRAHLRALWDEFEAIETCESKFANALDRFQALLLNSQSGGGSWATHRVTRSQVLARMQPVHDTLPALWSYVLDAIDGACESGAMVRD